MPPNFSTFAAQYNREMKIWKLIVMLFLVTSGITRSQTDKVSIDVEGTILCENRTLQGALVNVTRDGKPFTSFLTDIDGSYNLYLPLGSEFVVTVSKKDYVKKFYTVSTSGVSNESANKKFPVIVADVELFVYYEGLDYSLFNDPMNKYYFNHKKDNFEYDKHYLKMMLARVEEFKKNQKSALAALANRTEEEKKAAELARLDAMKKESEAMQQATLTKMIEEEIVVTPKEEEKPLVQMAAPVEVIKEKPPVNDATAVRKVVASDYVMALLLKYKPGVTEEIFEGKGVIITQRVVVRDDNAWVYQKKVFSWGGVACFRDGMAITQSTFEQETKKYI